MRIYIHLLFAAVFSMFLSTNHSFAQSAERKSKGINYSISLSKKKDDIKNVYFNLGLLSNLQQQHGLGINLISSIVHQDMKGSQISGFMNFTGGELAGFQFSGLANINRHGAAGFLLGGLINAVGGNAKGFGVAGVANLTGKEYTGLALGGIMNLSVEKMKGVQLSGVVNASGGTMNGVQLSLLSNISADIKGVQSALISNIAAKQIHGLQLGGVVNIAMNADKALQLASLSNICLNKMKGMQFSLGNYAENIENGVQIGLLNLSTGTVEGWQIGIINHSKDTTAHKIGFININPRTRIQPMFFGGNLGKFNMAVRFKNKRNYSILGIGSHYLDLDEKFSGCLFYRTGLCFPIKKKWEISGDLGYFHIENFENENTEIPERMYSLQARINLEYNLLRKLGLFISTGYSMTRYYHKNKFFEKKPIIEGGIVLF